MKLLTTDTSRLLRGQEFPARISVAQDEAFIRQMPVGAASVFASYQRALAQPTPSIQVSDPFASTAIDPFWFYQALERAVQGKSLEQELQQAQTYTELYLGCVRNGQQSATCARQVDPAYDGFNRQR